MTPLSSRISRIASSATMRVTSEVDRLRRQGVDVVDLGAGEPDFPTPPAIAAAAHAAIDAGFTKYTPVGGMADLKAAISARYRDDYGVDYGESEVIVSAGGKQALFNTAFALFSAGDEVITHGPCWPSLLEQVKLAEATPVVVQTRPDDGFAIRADALLRAVTPRTRGILINTPCNPTGAVMAEDELAHLATEAAARDLWVIVDLCYEKLVYGNVAHNVPGVLARVCRDRSVLCGSASKAYAMTGWRVGWSLGPSAVVAAQSAIQSHTTSNVSSIAQKAAVVALSGSQRPVDEMRAAYLNRRDRIWEWLAADPRLRCEKPAGAFYLFVDVSQALSREGLPTSMAFAEALLSEARVAVTPGEAFLGPGFVRLSFATSLDTLQEGARRILAFVDAHAPSTIAPGRP
jgi:aspartate aminotransferase